MKKLVMVFTVAVAAFATHAATCSWTISSVSKDGTALTSGSAYVFFADSAAAAQTQIAAIIGLAGTGSESISTAMSSANWSGTKKATAAGNFSMGSSAALGGYTLPTNADLGLNGSTTYYAYAVIFDTETITDSSNYMIAQGTATTAGAQTYADSVNSNRAFNIGGQSGNSANWNAVAVPEPTSGLMLLLGMAGLALRRRRA